MKRWTVLVVTPNRTWPVDLSAHRPSVVGRGRGVAVDLKDEAAAERVLSLSTRESEVLLDVLGGPVTVNDISVTGRSVVRAGDEIRAGRVRLIVCEVSPGEPVRVPLLGFDELKARLVTEVARGGPGRPVGVCAVSPPSLNVAARAALVRRVVEEVRRLGALAVWGELAGEVLMGLVLDASQERLGQLFALLPAVAGPRAQVATAASHQDGLDAEALLGALFRGLWGPRVDEVEMVVEDPVMVRLVSVMEHLAPLPGSVAVVGPEGSGRATLLRRLGAAAGRELLEVSGRDLEAVHDALRQRSRWVLLRGADEVPESVLATHSERLLVTSRTPLSGFEAVVQVPPLRARPKDIPLLAESFLSAARVVLARPRLHLGAEARALLTQWPWPGEVRELKNVMLRAARAALRDEVGRDSLPGALAASARAEDLRGAMRAAERELLLEALARTRWNVTAAATRLGLPRRTVVYRMDKLGLRRPARSPRSR